MEITEEQLEALAKIKEKSDDDYEKNLVYFGAGTLVLSMTFIEKIVTLENSIGIFCLITGWIFLTLTLIGNLVSHQLSSIYHERCRIYYAECDEAIPSTVERASKKQKIYYSRMLWINWGTTALLFLGISFLVIFCSINAYHKSQKPQTMSKEIKPQVQEVDIHKGRTPSQPAKPVQPKPADKPKPSK